MSTLANSNAIFAPCESLVSMAESGETFYGEKPTQNETVAEVVKLESSEQEADVAKDDTK